jgi:hypothetical protein
MAERLAPLLAIQVARVCTPVPAGPTVSVDKVSFFCNPVPGDTFSSNAIEIIERLKICSNVRHGIQHSKDSLCLLMVQYSKDK